ncbi:hypothetical protein G6F57_001480 [Rhizopus arrhizus]|nr:hypothetical protein G6F24_001136 [Rhizopus arrhizus]KAG1429106.1 hypothetical protein G6F58_000222 [Rhizopus delemar]KAG0949371.1 hypothetical protein G6F30_002278 [Rhizopus arrhizus]KAG0989754.1 hypothetical protein G6F29_000741 [Rhizopus arrhizus]KAG1000187.1 hypothetical protein G6F28_000299 [Rhizopus arrhizus]
MSFSKSQGKKQESGAGQYSKRQSSNSKKWQTNNPTTRNNSQPEYDMESQACEKVMHDRMLFLLGNLVGTVVEARVKDGCKFRGVFHGASTEGDLAIALNLAQKIFDPQSPIEKDRTNPNSIINTLLIYSKDLVEITITEVNLNESSHVSERNKEFKTDTDITGRLEIKERELHKWTPSEEDNTLDLLDGDLESSGETAWDQFAVNEKLFGLKTDFHEEIYTTPLNRSAPGFKDRERHAIKVANEIQKISTTNVHMLEERGILINDSGMDEEDLYGAVVRDNNKYIPPALRKQQQEQQTNKQQPQVKKETKNASVTDKVIANNPPKSNESPIANLPPLRKNSDEKDKMNENKQTNRIESEVADTFKHFAIKEKDKLHAKKQALQKKEIEERVAKLKMFHQTFKLNVPVPADLVPLLSTGKKNTSSTSPSTSPSDENSPKQESSPSATTPVASSKKNSPVAVPTTAQSPSPVPEGNTNQNATKASNSGTSFKLNAKASSFKPNPSAAAFVPSSSLTSVTYHDEKNSFFGGKHLKKELANDCITMKDAFKPPLLKKHDRPSSVGPTWPFGNMPYRVQFNQFYDENAFNGYASSGYGYGYPQYPYPHYVPGMPQMTVQQGSGPYMNPQFVSNSPQMTNISPHGSPFSQGFPSPQISHIVPQGMPPQMYQYQGGPMMMRYPPDMMVSNTGGPPVMMQRPMMTEPMQYSPHQRPETPASNSGTEAP